MSLNSIGMKMDPKGEGGGAENAFLKHTLKSTDRLIGESRGSCCREIQRYKEKSSVDVQ